MKTVVIYSGGLDSTVLLYQLKAQGHELSALSVDYGQRHRRELDCATDICQLAGIPCQIANLSAIRELLSGSSLTSPQIEVAEGHYTEASMKSTVVPNRNMILLSLAAGHALSIGATQVAYAAHSGDHAIYPDCRNEFADAVAVAMQLCDWQPIQLIRPFIDATKAKIVAIGNQLGVPFARTWSCYKGESLHCGRCGTCIERREAFYLAGLDDPTQYATDAPAIDTLIDNQWHLPNNS
ncbi:MAG: 7-cyano-7-deazaguanine synthase QueC [Coraliomargaritaceae bacterium]